VEKGGAVHFRQQVILSPEQAHPLRAADKSRERTGQEGDLIVSGSWLANGAQALGRLKAPAIHNNDHR
jgi:hypothetical protein